MTFIFETLPVENKAVLREAILRLFDRDIATVPCAFSTRNYVFIFGEGCFPAIIRVSTETPNRTVEDVLSELMWVDDLKNDIKCVCQPLPSRGNRLVERVVVEDAVYLVTMFRKANGAILADSQWDSAYFYNAGALLGKIHHTTSLGYQQGFRYKRKHWDQNSLYTTAHFDDFFDPSVRQNAEIVLEKIKNIPRDPRWYGMIHGDFQNGNLFYDWGELWAFDFDDCGYGYFLMDVASLLFVWVHSFHYVQMHPEQSAHDRLFGEDGILTQIKAGYSSAHFLPEEHWALFDDFFRFSVVAALSFCTTHEMIPKEILIALQEPMAEYLQYDRPPLERVEAVMQTIMNNLPQEVLQEMCSDAI